ncbi:DUF2516 family protein [Rhodococcus sp. NPDC003382]|uniref:DUF2516 family protein n=1 Tax=unclassified Rhodococcus (in: high G+C Gram-positive bacteria) TaxID=192944 RepID=UPI0018CDD9C1|nr:MULTISPECIES: DUF2516 family protein [unclassified Rhodococcus (in: high G+C Gram-positive bacteria)]MBH0123034.1 DUF2516 family protein [Rhodococcus sp. CX]MCK8669914.1 DUF2516 family protein [Rhodococcus sp. HM1]
MPNVDSLAGLILFALQILAIAGAVFALVHAVRQPAEAFPAVDKLTKPVWVGILAVALVVLFLFGAIGMLGIVGVVAVCVYLVDVRPRVEEVQRPRW